VKEEYLVEYSIMYQDKDMVKSGQIWDVVPELDPDTAAQYVLQMATSQASDEDLEVVAMARANKTLIRFNGLFQTVYTSPFERVDIHAPIFDEVRRYRATHA
jgi:hypothetical protein